MRSSRYTLPSPTALGFPARFSTYRAEQTRAIYDVTDSTRRHRIISAPTGIGKSLIALTTAVLTQARTLILTSNLALQKLYADAAGDIGLVDVRGASNYRCPALEPHGEYAYLRGDRPATADRGPCKSGLPCSLRSGGCPQYDQVTRARNAEVVITNYDYRLANRPSPYGGEQEESLGEFDYLFYDEMHHATEHVAKSMHVEFDPSVVRTTLALDPPVASVSIDEWREWAKRARVRLAAEYDALQTDLRFARDGGDVQRELLDEVNTLRALDRTLIDMCAMRGRWVVERIAGIGGKQLVAFDPVWVDTYVEERLYRGIPNVVGMSATVRPPEMHYLGVDADAFDFFEYDSPFPVANCPVYRWPVVRMHYNMSAGEFATLIEHMDVFIGAHQHVKGLIQAVSYKRAREIAHASEYGAQMITHDPRDAESALAAFKRARAPRILNSPRFSTGADFPGDEARYVLIPKVPYPPRESALMRARVESDRHYTAFYAAKEIVQMCGRIVRGMDDWGVAVIFDSAFGGLMSDANYLNFPRWFLGRMKFTSKCPPRMVR